MKGLSVLPRMDDLLSAMNRLQDSAATVTPAELALYCQWSRLEPRLAEALVWYLIQYWERIALGEFIRELSAHPWPRAAVVLFRFAALGAPPEQSKMIDNLADIIARSFPVVAPQLFFIPLQMFSRVVVDQEVTFRASPYTESGFIGAQSLLSRSLWPTDKTVLEKEVRAGILSSLLKGGRRVSVNDYRRASRGMISRRQAQRDLAAVATKKHGFTRGRWYVKA